MTDPFESSKFSISWAKDHIAELKREVDLFLSDKHACSYVTEPDIDGVYNLLKFRFTQPIPRAVRGHASDAAINIRNALDQANGSVHALCNLPTLDRFFPITRKKEKFPSILKGRCGELPQEIQDVISATEPYSGGNHLLWALNCLSGTHKHSILKPIVAANTLVAASGWGKDVQILHEPEWSSDKSEAVLMRIPIELFTNPKFNVNYHAAIFIAFDEIEFITGCEVIATLDEMADMVDGIVMALKAESQRLGLC
jgi:hypothetical protein